MREISKEYANNSKNKWIPNHIDENYCKRLFKIVNPIVSDTKRQIARLYSTNTKHTFEDSSFVQFFKKGLQVDAKKCGNFRILNTQISEIANCQLHAYNKSACMIKRSRCKTNE